MPGSAWCWSPRAAGAAGLQPDWSMPASMPRRNKTSPVGSMRRRPAPRCMARWDLRRRCNCGGCVLRIRRSRNRGTSTALSTCDLERFIAHDRRTMGFDRSALLTELGGRAGSLLLSGGHAVALIRDGRKARHIGPLFADDADSALALIDAIVRSEKRPAADRCRQHARRISCRALTGSGWVIERPFQRMRFGRATHASKPNCRSPLPARNLDKDFRHAS